MCSVYDLLTLAPHVVNLMRPAMLPEAPLFCTSQYSEVRAPHSVDVRPHR
jgi:hypothetical protein